MDFTTYFSDLDSEDEFESIKDTVKSEKYNQMSWNTYKSEDIYVSDSDDETLTSFSDISVKLANDTGDTCESGIKMNVSQSDTNNSIYETPIKTGRDSGDNSVITSNIKTKRRCLMMLLVLRRGYY